MEPLSLLYMPGLALPPRLRLFMACMAAATAWCVAVPGLGSSSNGRCARRMVGSLSLRYMFLCAISQRSLYTTLGPVAAGGAATAATAALVVVPAGSWWPFWCGAAPPPLLRACPSSPPATLPDALWGALVVVVALPEPGASCDRAALLPGPLGPLRLTVWVWAATGAGPGAPPATEGAGEAVADAEVVESNGSPARASTAWRA
mmetsp:Transcript_862/g.2303  ORF Transcript_862/g.2303 Transcript_862/m.2303 type:complete len:204 (-) Transcript_862:671-1282(-)